jgi:hypothetical protein
VRYLLVLAMLAAGCASTGYHRQPPVDQVRLSGYVATFTLYQDGDDCLFRVTYKDGQESRIKMDGSVCANAKIATSVLANQPKPVAPKPEG